jgi:hypothetical protein
LSAERVDASAVFAAGDRAAADALKLPPPLPNAAFPRFVYRASSGDEALDVENRDGVDGDEDADDDDDDADEDNDNGDSEGGDGVGSGRRSDGREALLYESIPEYAVETGDDDDDDDDADDARAAANENDGDDGGDAKGDEEEDEEKEDEDEDADDEPPPSIEPSRPRANGFIGGSRGIV